MYKELLSSIDGLVEELRTVSANVRLLTFIIENMETGGAVPNRTTFAESLNATSSHLDRISADLLDVLMELLKKTAAEADGEQGHQEPA